jgi:hypothetical protein
MKRHPTPLEVATRFARQREEADAARARLGLEAEPPPPAGLAHRLLICNRCHAVWPTERDESHGGSRLDGEPCAYVWEGQVCDGHVGPLFGQREAGWIPNPNNAAPTRAPYSGLWCETLGVPRGTTDLALVRRRYRELCKRRHPDAGGSHALMVALNLAYTLALSELGQP